jgi:hypothetical protein
MAFRELSGVAKELYLKKQIQELRAIYYAAQKSLVDKLKQLDITDFQKSRSEALLGQINQIIRGLDVKAYAWAKNSLPQSYERGIDFAAERLKALGVTRFVSYDAQVHTSATSILVDDVTVELLTANKTMEGFLSRYIRQSQQRILEDKAIDRMIAQGVVEGQTRRAVSDRILQELRAKIGEEKFLVINGRNYRPENYAELIARTRTREATSQGTINTALRYGVDLVQWDVHSEICEYCQQYAGRVYSLSGADNDFPQLTEKPPLHPNCKCIITPITRESLVRRGYLDEVIKLSSSKLIEVPSFSRFEEILAEL